MTISDAVEQKHLALLHTLPPGPNGIRAEDAVYRQYNSCVDFTFKSDQQFMNAKRLKRLNLIFERAADRNFVGLREDKLLMILPPGAAAKYGLDSAKIQNRAQETKNRQSDSSGEELVDKKRSKKKKKRKKKVAKEDVKGIRVLSRGTFLAMFANESSGFINLMAQNVKAHRMSKKMEKKSAGQKLVRQAKSSPLASKNSLTNSHSVTSFQSQENKIDVSSNKQPSARRKKVSTSNSSQRSKRKTHRRRSSVHSINSKDSELQFDVPSDIASSIFDWGTSSHDHANIVSDISDSETSYVPRRTRSLKQLNTIDQYHFEKDGPLVTENGIANLISQTSYNEHPADEAGGHATVVSLSSQESFVRKQFNDKQKESNRSSSEENLRRRELRRLKHQQRMQEYQEEILAAQMRMQYLDEQNKLHKYVTSTQQIRGDNECVFLSSVVNVLKNLLLPKKNIIYVAPEPYSGVSQLDTAHGPRYEQMHVMGYEMYNTIPANSQRYQ